MGDKVPYLGSRIVLISKSEIRYEGTLYTIDTNNSTVALQNVRSFGTEAVLGASPGGAADTAGADIREPRADRTGKQRGCGVLPVLRAQQSKEHQLSPSAHT